jgi:hypothetical protein
MLLVLAKTIECLIELKDIVRILIVFEVGMLLNVDRLLDGSIEKYTFHTHLKELGIMARSIGQYKMRIDLSLAIGAKVSLKSKPSTCEYPLATSQAWFLIRTPYSSCLL